MDAKELRIGNYFNGDTEEDVTVVKTTPKHIEDLYNDPLDDYYKPIPLTEEWLVKFGFEIEDRGSWFESKHYLIDVSESTIYLRKCCYDGYYFGFDIDHLKNLEFHDVRNLLYVNQLQNLYFALTGQELEIKE